MTREETPAETCRRIGEVFKKAYFSEDARPAQTEEEYFAGLAARAERERARKARQAATA